MISCLTADRDNLRISFTFFTEQKKVTKKCSTIYPRHFPSFRFATNGTTDKAHDLNRAKLLLASPLCHKETLCFFSLGALRYSAEGKLGNFEQAISWEGELWGIINQIVSVPRGRIVFGSGFRHFECLRVLRVRSDLKVSTQWFWVQCFWFDLNYWIDAKHVEQPALKTTERKQAILK